MSKELFGTDGIRGIPGEYPLDDQTLYWVGRSIGGYLRLQNEHPRVLIGTDTRESGTHIASEIAAGLAKEGIHNSFAGVITTPGVACLVRKEGFAAGVVISASHNPYHDNGIKLFAGSGMKFPDDIEEQIEIEIVHGGVDVAMAHQVRDLARFESRLGHCRSVSVAHLVRMHWQSSVARLGLAEAPFKFACSGPVPLAWSKCYRHSRQPGWTQYQCELRVPISAGPAAKSPESGCRPGCRF